MAAPAMPFGPVVAKICKVLIVEDEQEIQLLLQNLFVDAGYYPVVAYDGNSARGILDADAGVNVAIVDIVLPPGPDGFTLAKQAAECGRGVILVTGDHRYLERMEKTGHRYLLKPYSTGSLLQMVKEELARTQLNASDWLRRPAR
jgi:DNA-binding NtrC family response regulator